jgi:hypothetical protein
MNSQNRQSILLEKHALSLTKKLYDVTLGNLLGYNKKVFYRSTLTYQQSVKVKQTVSLHPGKPPFLFYDLFAGVQP